MTRDRRLAFDEELAAHRAAVARASGVEPDGAEIDTKGSAGNADGAASTVLPSFPIMGNPRERLPEPAREHLEALETEAQEQNRALNDVREQLHELRQDRDRIRQRIDRLTKHPTHALSPDDPAVMEENKRVERLTKRIEPLEQRHAEKQERWRELAALVGAIDHWIADHVRRGAWQMYQGPEPQLRKSETFAQAVERIRKRIRELKADRAQHIAAPVPAAQAKQLLRAEVARYAELGRPDVVPVVDYGQAVRWPVAAMNKTAFGSLKMSVAGGDGSEVFDGAALLLWAFRDQITAALEKEVDALANDKAALSAEDRARLLAEVDRDTRANEIEEELFVRAASEAGQPIERRRDAMPAAVLLIELA